MKRTSTIFLQLVIVLIGIITIIFMLWEPQIEGRNLNSTFLQIYFNDPFLVYAYLVSIPFFIILYQVFTLFGYIRQNKVFSLNSIRALRTIKYCAISLVCFIVAPEAYLFVVRPGDDIAGGVAIGLFLIFFSIVIATVADIFEGILQNILSTSPKNDLMSD